MRQYFAALAAGVAHYREVAELTQEDLAIRVGVTQRTIRAIEAGTANPAIASILRIQAVLSVPSLELLFGDQFPTSAFRPRR